MKKEGEISRSYIIIDLFQAKIQAKMRQIKITLDEILNNHKDINLGLKAQR